MGRNNTQFFHVVKEQEYDVASILKDVYEALTEKGYNPVNQIVGYIMSEIRLILPVIRMREA